MNIAKVEVRGDGEGRVAVWVLGRHMYTIMYTADSASVYRTEPQAEVDEYLGVCGDVFEAITWVIAHVKST